MSNVQDALHIFTLASLHCCLDSSVAGYWVEETTSSLWLTDYGRLKSVLRLSTGTYQQRIILHILPAVMDWYLKLRTNYGRGNQNGLLTLGNDETVLSPHPVRNLTKRRKPQRSCSPWLSILTLSSTNSLPRTHTGEPRECVHGSFCLPKTQNYKNSTQNKGSSLYIQTEKRNLVWLLRASRQGTGKHRRRVTESKLTQEKTRMARVL